MLCNICCSITVIIDVRLRIFLQSLFLTICFWGINRNIYKLTITNIIKTFEKKLNIEY